MNKRTPPILLLIIFAILLIPSALAIRLTPAGVQVDYIPGEKHILHFSVSDLKTNGVEVSTGGDFSRSLTVLTDTSTCVESCSINVEFTVPQFPVDSPGKKESYITFRELAPASAAAISAVGSVRIPIMFYVPYPNKFIVVDVKTKSGQRRFQHGEKVYFIVHVQNHGQQTIETLGGNIEIKSENGDVVKTIPLTTQTNFAYPGSTELYAEWNIENNLPRGVYFYNAIVDYDGNTMSHSRALEVGEQLVEIREIQPLEFAPDTINRAEAVLYNSWSSPLATSVTTSLLSADGKIMGDPSRSNTIEAPEGDITRISLFVDVGEIAEGKYILQTTTHFGDDLTHVQNFDAVVAIPQASAPSLEQPETSASLDSYLIPILLITIISVAIVLIVLYLRKHKGGKSRSQANDEF